MKNEKIDITIDTYDKIVKEYIEYFNSKDLCGGVQFQKEIDLIVSQIPNNSTILDAGCATGDYCKYLEGLNKNYKIIGIDSSKNMIEVAKSKTQKSKFEVMDIRDIKYPKKYFNSIICFATLIHVDDENCLNILNEFDNMLKDRGILAINVMEYNGKEKELFDKEPFNPKYKTYFNTYSKDFFLKYLIKKGYEILIQLDNPIFNPDSVKKINTETNQFSIIARKKSQ